MNNRQLLYRCSSLFQALFELDKKTPQQNFQREYRASYNYFHESLSILVERYSDILEGLSIKHDDSISSFKYWEHKWHVIFRQVEAELMVVKRAYSDLDVLFQNIRENILVEIVNAHTEIIIAMAWLTDQEIWNTLQEKICEGTKIEIIVSDSEENFSKSNNNYLRIINDQGGNVWVTKTNVDEGMMHHKFCVIDKKQTITGSYNWTYRGGFNLENIVIIRDNIVVANEYLKKFNQIKTLPETVLLKDYMNKSNTILI